MIKYTWKEISRMDKVDLLFELINYYNKFKLSINPSDGVITHLWNNMTSNQLKRDLYMIVKDT